MRRVRDDIRAAFGSDRPESYWQDRSDYIARFWWRVLIFVLVLLALGTIVEACT